MTERSKTNVGIAISIQIFILIKLVKCIMPIILVYARERS